MWRKGKGRKGEDQGGLGGDHVWKDLERRVRSVARIPGGCYSARWQKMTKVWCFRKTRHFCCVGMLVNMLSWGACLMIPPILTRGTMLIEMENMD